MIIIIGQQSIIDNAKGAKEIYIQQEMKKGVTAVWVGVHTSSLVNLADLHIPICVSGGCLPGSSLGLLLQRLSLCLCTM